MKKIVVSAIIATVVKVGAYLIALALGASAWAATVAAFATAFATAAATFVYATDNTDAAFATAVVVTAAAVVDTLATTAIVAYAVVGTLAIAGIAALVSGQEGITPGWAFAAYALEAGAIGNAFMVNSTVWSIAIALSGVVALLVLWRLAPKPIATPDAPSASTVPERNGA